MGLKKLFLILFTCWACSVQAQYDSTFYVRFSNKLAVSLYESQRNISYLFTSRSPVNPSIAHAMNYQAEANTVTGLELDYDKLSFSLNVKSIPGNVLQHGKTIYTDLGASVGGNTWILSGAFTRYHGFYDLYTANYDTAWKANDPLNQNHSMISDKEKLKFMYFFRHKKFSFKSAYTCSYRQLKSNWSPVAEFNAYRNNLFADTSFAPGVIRNNFGPNSDLDKLRVLAVSAGGGVSFTIVLFKRLFYNLTLIGGLEAQWRDYDHEAGKGIPTQYLALNDDVRSSVGYNGDRFFMSFYTMTEVNFFNSSSLYVRSTFYSANFSIGYRFGIPDKGLILKLKNNKYYKML